MADLSGVYTEKQLKSAGKIHDYMFDCDLFAREELGFMPDPWQKTLFDALSSNDPMKQRIAMKACKGVGKTAGLAAGILWFMTCKGEPGLHPKGAATSITEDNIDDNLWPEISTWQNKSDFLKRAFTWTKSRFSSSYHPNTWFFSKRTWPKTADQSQQANTLAGFHGKFIMFVLDESGDIPQGVMAAADAGLTGTEEGRFQKIIQAGNPTRRDGPLFNAVHGAGAHKWFVITITGDPNNPNRSKRQSLEWALEQIKEYGIDSPWVRINVFGEFPEHSINALISDTMIDAAVARNYALEAFVNGQKRLGVDVARYGDDMSTIYPRQGLKAFKPVEMSGWSSTQVADRVIMSKEKWGAHLEFVDSTGGYGSGVIDSMIARGYSPIEVGFAEQASQPARFMNRRAEIYWRTAEWLKKGQLLDGDYLKRLRPELLATEYTIKNGKILLMPKEMVKSKIGRSPDLADGLALTFGTPDKLAHITEEGQAIYAVSGSTSAKSDWDPLKDA